jgi:hypothetical protein
MTGSAMSLIAYGGSTDGMKISDTTSHYNISMFWHLLSMCIPGAVPQPLISDETNNVRMSLPHTCTFLHMSLESNGRQEPHFDYHHKELDVNDVETCLPWGWDMLLGDGGYSLNVWDGESLENRFQLDRKGKVEECQHATLLNVPFK